MMRAMFIHLSRLRERVSVRAILRHARIPGPSAPALIEAFSRKREKGKNA
jgi:hypothetical protein